MENQKTLSGKIKTPVKEFTGNETYTFPSEMQKERQSLPVLLPAGDLNPKVLSHSGIQVPVRRRRVTTIKDGSQTSA